MNLKKRLLAIGLTTAMAVTAFGATAFADESDIELQITSNSLVFDEDSSNHSIRYIWNDGDVDGLSLDWDTSNDYIATVSDNGVVDFHNPGQVTISVSVNGMVGIRDSITFTVRSVYGDSGYYYDANGVRQYYYGDYTGWDRGDDYFYDPVTDMWFYDDGNDSRYYTDEYYFDEYGLDRRLDNYAELREEKIRSGAYITNPYYDFTRGRYTGGGIVRSEQPTAEDTRDFARTVDLTAVAGQTTVVNAAKASAAARLDNYASVTTDVLKAAAAATTGVINFDTRVNGSLMGRVQINPANAADLASGTIMLGVHYRDSATKFVSDLYNKSFSNEVHVIKCDQNNYGMSVKLFASVGTGVDASSLVFYSYNAANNSYSRIDVTGVSVDANGFLSFNTTVGGTILVSEGGAFTK
jgi:hypothetical protein